MSSSNLVRVTLIPETTYGVTPPTGSFGSVRYISEGLSGTPDTVESQQIRTDRMSSGQVVTGLQVGGDIGFELAPSDESLEDLMASAMFQQDWTTFADVNVALEIDTVAKTIERTAGSFITDGVKIGSVLTLDGFTNDENNTQVMITSVTALALGFSGPSNMISETAAGAGYLQADRLDIGTTKRSFSMEKAFLDLTNKAINYRGMIVSDFEMTMAYGALASGSFSLSGNDYETVATAAEFMTFGRTITPAATSNTLNGSVDMPFLISSAVGTLGSSGLAINSVSISLANNLSAQNVIGEIAPIDYSAGTAQISVDISAYLTDPAWPILAKKLSQESFALGFKVGNVDGWYAFYMPAVQVSFDDPSSGGANQDILLEMSGTAKVGPAGVSALTIYRG